MTIIVVPDISLIDTKSSMNNKLLTINRSRLNCNTINTKSIQRNIPKDTDIFSLASVSFNNHAIIR